MRDIDRKIQDCLSIYNSRFELEPLRSRDVNSTLATCVFDVAGRTICAAAIFTH